ncbi:hypothetical protein GDO78_002384 [Eleutherodactylus coqui]|uniref:Uncharacterized protein n=1 Tax=Eleutherodactylus coqui TaxID=57060 RepID=A0A8J6EYG2_ELECQ|nr:hypothetical protein GDO78_002384 [Eleutherodactylus coqui]
MASDCVNGHPHATKNHSFALEGFPEVRPEHQIHHTTVCPTGLVLLIRNMCTIKLCYLSCIAHTLKKDKTKNPPKNTMRELLILINPSSRKQNKENKKLY